MLFFIRSFIPDYDSKIKKYFSALESKNIQYNFVGWDRAGTIKENEKNIIFRKKGIIGGGFKNIINLFLWNIFIIVTLIKNRKNIEVVHVVDLDSALPSFVFCKFFSKKIIFDIYDKYSDTHNINNIMKICVDKIENFIIKNSDICILADECRKEQHNIESEKNIIIIENIPELISFNDTKKNILEKNNKIKLGYFGVLEKKHRGIEDIVQVISQRENFELHIIGYGPLEEILLKSPQENIKFYGALSYKEGIYIMSQMDVLVGMYYKTIKNHFYAAPNKYFEHLMLGKAFLTTINIPPGNKTMCLNTGWAIDEGEESLSNFFDNILKKEDIYDKSNNAKINWAMKYNTYYDDVYVNIYGRVVGGFINKMN